MAMAVVDIWPRRAEIEIRLPVASTVDTGFVNNGAARRRRWSSAVRAS
jgi:hypothetical protein